jgi:four helix bundle protein
MPEPVLHSNGGYRKLRAYQVSEIIFDITYHFVHRFLEKGDRTQDQMIQAARSGKQNIAEGSAASGTSRETEIKLTGVARASLDELREDYLDYLTAHGESDWPADDSRKVAMHDFCLKNADWPAYKRLFLVRPPEVLCNLQLVLINQTRLLLDRLLAH